MKNIRNLVFPFSRSRRPAGQKAARKTRGQSLVEIAIAFPVLIMMLAGLVEFGFMLNYYLSGAKAIPKTVWLACLGWEAMKESAPA